MKKQDLIYEFLKYDKKNGGHIILPREEEGSSYLEVCSVSDLREVDPSKIILVHSGEESAVKNQVRLMDAGFEVLHPAVLLNLLLSKRMPASWRGKFIDFLGAWYCAKNWNGCGNNPVVIGTFWLDWRWVISYGSLDWKRGDRYTAVTTR